MTSRGRLPAGSGPRRALAAMGLLLLVGLPLAGCGERPPSIDIDGSSTVFPISDAVVETFVRETGPRLRMTVGKSGTGGGMKKFTAGEIDVCDASREIAPSEIEALESAGVGFVEFPVALDGIVVVVHPQNDWVDALTVKQLAHVWRPGDPAQKWSDLDPAWPDKRIRLYGPGTDSGTFEYFTKAIVGVKKSCRADFTASEDDNVLVTGVSKDRYSLGYFGFAYYAENRDKLKLLAVGPTEESCVRPTISNIRSNGYAPLSRPLFIYVRQSLLDRPDGAEFVRFYLDHAGDLAGRVGYVALADETAAANKTLLEASLAKRAADEPSPPLGKDGGAGEAGALVAPAEALAQSGGEL